MSSPSFQLHQSQQQQNQSPQHFQQHQQHQQSELSPLLTWKTQASMTQLPPSPELKSSLHQQQTSLMGLPGEFSLLATSSLPSPTATTTTAVIGNMTSSSNPLLDIPASANIPSLSSPPATTTTTAAVLTRRLRSVARYQAFHPQALACSNVLTSALVKNEDETTLTTLTSTNITNNTYSTKSGGGGGGGGSAAASTISKDPGPSSLGAIAGVHGVALFRLSRPHVPLLILSHASGGSGVSSRIGTTSPYSPKSVSCMAFQPTLTTYSNNNTSGGHYPSSSSSNSTPQSLYLAATRGSGVLIWDASGHSPNPLIGRLGMMDGTSFTTNTSNTSIVGNSEFDDGRILSIAWKPSTSSPLLGTVTSSSLSLWDLRSNSSNFIFKPNLRFGTTTTTFSAAATTTTGGVRLSHSFLERTTMSPLVQGAFSNDNDCATLDASGIVRIYDLRMTDRSSSSTRSYNSTSTPNKTNHTGMGSPVSVFAAHETAGVGISYFPFSDYNPQQVSDDNPKTRSRWLTWGLDAHFSSTVVKVWTKNCNNDNDNDSNSKQQQTPMDADEYWAWNSDYTLTAQCARPNLACARVAATPVEDSFVAVGHNITSESSNASISGGGGGDGGSSSGGVNSVDQRGWWAELYTITDNNNDINKDENQQDGTDLNPPHRHSSTFGMKKLAGFQGGTASSKNNGDGNALMSVLGSRVDLGNLAAAELAFSGSSSSPSSSNRPHLLTDESALMEKYTEDEPSNTKPPVELLLCCMSDTGVVTTHVIPEATPKFTDNHRLNDPTRRDLSPKRNAPRALAIRTAFPASNQTRVYPEDREGSSFADAAGFYGGTNKQSSDAAKNRMEEVRTRFELLQPAAPLFSPENDDPPSSLTGRRDAEGGLMPFDMDVPVAYGSVATGGVKNIQLGITDMASGTVVSSTGIGVVEESETVTADVLDSTTIMENIETERVACPRLCGASFGMGGGGLVVFHNGEVKKMWSWYQRTDALRLTGVMGGKTDNTSADPTDNFRTVKSASGTRASNPLSPRVEQSEKQNLPDTSSGPRTLKELVNMMATAKEAQWGDQTASDGSESQSGDSAGDNFFEDESLDSNSSDSGDDTSLTPPSGHDIYERYFGGRAWKGTIEKAGTPGSPSRAQGPGSPIPGSKLRSTYGPSSDMLSPVVTISHDLNAAVLNDQSIALAMGWELGRWDVTQPLYTDDPKGSINEMDSSFEAADTDDARAQYIRKGLPHYRYLAPLSRRQTSMPRPRSDPNLFKTGHNKSKSLGVSLDDPGVHGGEYTVRPNMEESMTFLKKLFTHQQEGGRTLSPLMSPPDSPGMYQNLSKGQKTFSTSVVLSFGGNERNYQRDEVIMGDDAYSGLGLGVYTILEEKTSEDDEGIRKLEDIKRICLHNAMVCENLGASEKEGVWKLLAQIVDSQMDSEGKLFNGWGGRGGGALGVNLVSNLLEYYEKLRDVQMLATIFCVLSGGRTDASAQTQPHLLPQGREANAKYDSYIKKYADLLYSWGLLSIRAELNKHLLRVPPRKEGDTSMEDKTETGRSPGIAVVFRCPTCGRDADFNANICRTCQDFAFRCSICDNAVRGLFTVCDVCNHGGHVDHMKTWFSNHAECPTGCGCTCSFASFLPQKTEITTEYQ